MPRKGGNPLVGYTEKTPRTGVNDKLPEAFHNDIDAPYTRKREKHQHRLMIMMASNGKNHTEIAEALGASTATVSHVLRQPWAREKMQSFMKENAADNLRALLKGAAGPALERVVALSQSETVKPEVALAASRDILDRFMGKATQPTTVENVTPEKMSDEEIEKRLAELRQQ